MSIPQDPPFPFPPPPHPPLPEPGQPDPDDDEPPPIPLPSFTVRDPRMDPQPGDELLGLDGRLRKVLQREGNNLRCQDGVMRYTTTVQRWKEQWGKKSKDPQKTP